MKNIIKFLLLSALLQPLIFPAQGQEKTQLPYYHLIVRIDTALATVEYKAEIQNPHDSCFFLNRSANINHIFADGKEVAFHQNPSDFSPNSSEITIETNVPGRLVIEYSEPITAEFDPRTSLYGHLVNIQKVQLGVHSDWYPVLKKGEDFNLHLEVHAPSNWSVVTNCSLKEEKMQNSYKMTRWESYEPGNTIAIIAAPKLKMAMINRNGITAEIYYSKLPQSYIDSMKGNVLKIINMLSAMMGSQAIDSLIRVAYSPGPYMGAYNRYPLIVLSEERTLERLCNSGQARDIQLLAHELAHSWYSAESEWISEGLSEFLSFLVSETISGKDYADMVLLEYKEIADNSIYQTAIVDTVIRMEERTANLYIKPALLLYEIRQKYSDEKLMEFLKAINKRILASEPLSTESFLNEMENHVGKEAKDFFSEALHRKKWNTSDTLLQMPLQNADTIFLGTWTGLLTQMGATQRIIVHLFEKDKRLYATIDSPDQGVEGIIPVVKITGDSIHFKLPAFSAGFAGFLDRGNMTIQCEWEQSGIIYPLYLTKDNKAKIEKLEKK